MRLQAKIRSDRQSSDDLFHMQVGISAASFTQAFRRTFRRPWGRPRSAQDLRGERGLRSRIKVARARAGRDFGHCRGLPHNLCSRFTLERVGPMWVKSGTEKGLVQTVWSVRRSYGAGGLIELLVQIAAYSGIMRARSRSTPARPYTARLRVFSLLICPSVCPLLQGSDTALRTASRSWRIVLANCCIA